MAEQQQQFWQLQEFSKQVEVHYTTLNDWSNLLERERVHYINRATGTNKKVYDELDLQVFKFIKAKREENWSLTAIMDLLPSTFPNLRPFPENFNDNQQIVTVDQLKQEFMHLMNDTFKNYASEFMQQVIDIKKALPNPEEERAQRVNQMITENRIRHALELEALEEWAKLPETERMVKVGLFRKDEDSLKRERFIKKYIYEHFEERLKQEFGL